MNYKKILLAVDGSEHSRRAAGDAADLAARKDAEILLLTCYYTGMVEEEQPFVDTGQFANLAAEARQVLAPYEEMLRSRGIAFASQTRIGVPEDAIVEVAKAENCDLIVLGSRGLGKVMGLLLGSVTKAVVQTAPCSVLVVR